MVHSRRCIALLQATLMLVLPVVALRPTSSPTSSISRRDSIQFVAVAVASASSFPFLSMMLPIIQPAHAARGAAELDFEYYMRDLVGGNKREGTVQASKPPPVPPPRTLQGPLLPLLLDKDCSQSCIPVKALIQQLQTTTKSSMSTPAIIQDIQSSVASIKERTYKSFYAKAPWQKEDVSDQYYFDFTAYALWKTAAVMLPDNTDRDRFARSIGKLLLEHLESGSSSSDPLLRPPSTSSGELTLVGSTSAIQQALQLFQSSGYCKEFRIRTTDDEIGDRNNKATTPVFDELDDESIAIGSNVDCLVSVIEPASLGASLQINGEQSRFGPDYVGTTLAAIWDKYAGISSSWETFFVDAVYRPNPKDYFPNEQLFQFTLTKKKDK
ncbi:hypothetical protein IV203_038782 [Nitzschia inconspicua]|uniref:Uncharacterized protein n=1 Tax=Nitzschia inconspicua TaxID=303405 RepID=A0A9K3PZL6_9STRA|nr:hypothetical protein IV203_038782 [Nitzschia inconspicua]